MTIVMTDGALDVGGQRRWLGDGWMKTLMVIVAWCLLFILCWPLALLAIVLWPLLWVVSLPFRLVSITFDAAFALLKAILMLPARLLGYRAGPAGRMT
jgi:hypothetical protein